MRLPSAASSSGAWASPHTHGTDNCRALISLCLICGQIGREGTGLHPLRGQNNVQGASDVGLIPMVYTGYQDVDSPRIRRKFEKAWGRKLDPEPGLTVMEVADAALKGEIKGMYIMGENPAMSDPNLNHSRGALASLEFLVVQDIFLTETAYFADVVLPSTAFPEKTGTYTNTDRRVQIGRRAIAPPGEAREDWRIVAEISERLGYPMDYESEAEISMKSHRSRRSWRECPTTAWEVTDSSGRAPGPITRARKFYSAKRFPQDPESSFPSSTRPPRSCRTRITPSS